MCQNDARANSRKKWCTTSPPLSVLKGILCTIFCKASNTTPTFISCCEVTYKPYEKMGYRTSTYCSPNVIVPRQISETTKSDHPSFFCLIAILAKRASINWQERIKGNKRVAKTMQCCAEMEVGRRLKHEKGPIR
jgi:hypothetical protein